MAELKKFPLLTKIGGKFVLIVRVPHTLLPEPLIPKSKITEGGERGVPHTPTSTKKKRRRTSVSNVSRKGTPSKKSGVVYREVDVSYFVHQLIKEGGYSITNFQLKPHMFRSQPQVEMVVTFEALEEGGKGKPQKVEDDIKYVLNKMIARVRLIPGSESRGVWIAVLDYTNHRDLLSETGHSVGRHSIFFEDSFIWIVENSDD